MSLKAIIHFFQCDQLSQTAGEGVQHLEARVHFSLSINKKVYTPLTAIVNMEYGGDYKTDPIHVSHPDNYNGPIDYMSYSGAAEAFYRKVLLRITGSELTPSAAKAFVKVDNVKNLVMSGNTFSGRPMLEMGPNSGKAELTNNTVKSVTHTDGFEIKESGGGW